MTVLLDLFDNKMRLCGALMLWTVASSSVFCFIMVADGSSFLTIGPNPKNELLGVKMDTWFKWWVTAIYTFISTAVAAFSSDALCPFFSNVIEDHKTKYIPYSKFHCLMMVQCFTVYGVIMSVIGMFVALTQVDFMLIRIAADLLVNSHTTFYFLRGKEVDAERYDTWKSGCENNRTIPQASCLQKIVESCEEEKDEDVRNDSESALRPLTDVGLQNKQQGQKSTRSDV